MVRGPKKHLKRLNAPKSWMLDKLTGVFAPKPAPGTSLLLFLDFFLLRVKWMSAKEKGGKEIVGDDERANDKETMMELHARRVFLLECCVASLSWRSHARSFLLLLLLSRCVFHQKLQNVRLGRAFFLKKAAKRWMSSTRFI